MENDPVAEDRRWQRERDEERKEKKKDEEKIDEKEAQIRIRLPKQATVQQKAIRRVKLNLAGGRCI